MIFAVIFPASVSNHHSIFIVRRSVIICLRNAGHILQGAAVLTAQMIVVAHVMMMINDVVTLINAIHLTNMCDDLETANSVAFGAFYCTRIVHR